MRVLCGLKVWTGDQLYMEREEGIERRYQEFYKDMREGERDRDRERD